MASGWKWNTSRSSASQLSCGSSKQSTHRRQRVSASAAETLASASSDAAPSPGRRHNARTIAGEYSLARRIRLHSAFTGRDFLFTSESVTEGHPDKICDEVADAVLDSLLSQDPSSRVAIECMETTGSVHVAGEVSTTGFADVLPIVQIHYVDEGHHRSAFHALLVASRRKLSLVDCVSFESMRRSGLERAFCFDPHFAEQGFTVLPDAG
jgi:predicted nucleic acid-binding protein